MNVIFYGKWQTIKVGLTKPFFPLKHHSTYNIWQIGALKIRGKKVR